MSLITDLETEAEKVFHEVEAKVEEFDGEALAEARRLLADAKTAESRVITFIGDYKAEIVAAAEKYGPEVVQLIIEELDKLLSQARGLFGVRPQE
jgi:histidinol dehydrogenase